MFRSAAERVSRIDWLRRGFQVLIATGSAVTLVYSVIGDSAAHSIVDSPAPVAGATGMSRHPDVTKGIPTESRATAVKLDAMNVLVLGTDSREGLAPGEKQKYHLGDVGSGGSDTIMLIHLSSDRKHATVVSFPRDLWVEIPAFEGKSAVHMKINAAYARGGDHGPNLALYTIEQLTGIHVDHYMSINVPSLGRMVDALGGVDVCLPQAVDDTMFQGKKGGSGLKLPAGRSHLDGVQAVAYVRTRHKDTGDGPEDFGRIRRQQKFVASILTKAMDSGMFTDLSKLNEVVQTIAGALTLDSTLDGKALFDIASGLQGLNTGRVTFVTVPVANSEYVIDGQDAMKMDDKAARKLFDEVINDKPITTPKPATPSASASPTASATADPNHVHTAADDPCAPSAKG